MSIKFDCVNKIPLTEGGEGVIYEIGDQIIKIYKPIVNLQSKKNKIVKLMQKSLPKEVVAPKDIVVDRKGKFIGFVMDKVEGEEFKRLSNKKFTTANGITTKHILTMLVKTQNVIRKLHEDNIFIGDLNDQNILFDKQYNIYFIDCDSWSVDSDKCEVAMDLFKDPLLNSNEFNDQTDIYSFSILAWKILTRVHPFGGTMNPDINIVKRMEKRISIIDNPNVTIPRTIKTWRNLSPNLVSKFKSIFESDRRILGDELSEMLCNMKYCNKDKEYYYGDYSVCPLCDVNAKVRAKPVSTGSISGLKLFPTLDGSKIKMVFDEKSYLDINDYIIDVKSRKKVKYHYGIRYYFTADGYLIEDFLDMFIVHSNKEYIIEKKYKSHIIVDKNHIYYISKQNSFIDMNILGQGNCIQNICKCSNTTYFEVCENNYCIVNFYQEKLIANINGNNVEIKYNSDIINYGIHYDNLSGKWLLIFENSQGKYKTFIITKGKIDYETDQIKYNCQLNAPCLSNSILFIPVDGRIRGFSYQKSAYKDFECEVVSDSSKLIKKKNKFVIINDENLYCLG